MITKIDALQQLEKKLKVCAYARVSSGKDAMLHSLSAQVSYYNNLIQNTDGWEFVGIYADEAISGTKDTREEFNRMLEDARAGKIDLIITKAISRFARNTATLLTAIRELNSLGIDVLFEEQNLHSMSGEGEMILTLLASVVQEEMQRRRNKIKWKKNPVGSPLKGLIKCGHCGKNYLRKDHAYRPHWVCATYARKGKNGCPTKRIDEGELLNILESLKIEISSIKEIKVFNDMTLCILNKDGTKVSAEWKVHSKKDSWTPEMKQRAQQRELERHAKLWQE